MSGPRRTTDRRAPTEGRLEASLRAALQSAAGDGPVDRHTRSTILASIAGMGDGLMNVYEQEAGPEQALVDLHLDGPGVVHHAANAQQFSLFVSGMSDAVKETAKSYSGRKSYASNLLVEGAGPGSVRVVLRVADQPVTEGQAVDPRTIASRVDSDALRTVAAVMAHASDDDPDGPLIAEIAELPVKARTALKRVANASVKGGWGVSGTIRQRHIGAAPLALTADGARRLRIELNSAFEKKSRAQVVGTIDGFRWSMQKLYFQPSSGGQFAAGVIDGKVAQAVTALMRDPERRVLASFDVVESFLPGEGDTERKRISRVLRSVEPLGEQAKLDISDLS